MDIEQFAAIVTAHQRLDIRRVRRPGYLRTYFDQFGCPDEQLLAVAQQAAILWDARDAQRDRRQKGLDLAADLAYALGAAHALGTMLQPQTDRAIERAGAGDMVLARWEFGRCETLERTGRGAGVWDHECRIPAAPLSQSVPKQ